MISEETIKSKQKLIFAFGFWCGYMFALATYSFLGIIWENL